MKGWADLSNAERDAARTLGYDEPMWQEGISPEACLRPWKELSAALRRAACTLGYNEADWEDELAHEDPIILVGDPAASAAA